MYLALQAVEHRTTRVRRPHTNGFVEHFHQTVQNEFFGIKFRETFYTSVEELQADLNDWLHHYNYERPHLGYRNQGQRPYDRLQKYLTERPGPDSSAAALDETPSPQASGVRQGPEQSAVPVTAPEAVYAGSAVAAPYQPTVTHGALADSKHTPVTPPFLQALSSLRSVPVPATGEALALEAVPVLLDDTDPGRDRVGELRYLGGLWLRSSDPPFGALSDLLVSTDGARLFAVSDCGQGFTASLSYDAAGRLAGVGDARVVVLVARCHCEGHPFVNSSLDGIVLSRL